MKTVGELLKAEREKKGLSLHEVGMTLKINPKILKALEENDTQQLPAKTFVRGFIRSYAQFLRLDPQNILQLLQAEMGPSNPEPSEPIMTSEPVITPVSPPTPENTSSPKKKEKRVQLDDEGFNSKKMAALVGSLLLVALIVFVAKMVDKYQREGRRPEPEVVTDSQKINPDLAPPTESMEAAVADPSQTPALNVALSTPVQMNTPVPMATAAITPIATATAVPTPAATPTPTASPSPTATPTDASAKPVEVIVEALNKVEIHYSFGSEDRIQTLILNADEIHTFKSKSKLHLEFSDGGAVSLVVNGRDRGVPGKMGQTLKLTFPK